MTKACYLQGAVINSYANVEFLLTDLIMRSRSLPEYSENAASFPHSMDKKIATVRRLAAAAGPLGAYRDDLLGVLKKISSFDVHRHFMAHGLMVVNSPVVASDQIIFRMYRVAKQGSEEVGKIETNVDQFANLAQEVGNCAKEAAVLIARIFREVPLDPV